MRRRPQQQGENNTPLPGQADAKKVANTGQSQLWKQTPFLDHATNETSMTRRALEPAPHASRSDFARQTTQKPVNRSLDEERYTDFAK
jgi:hypothetical protein